MSKQQTNNKQPEQAVVEFERVIAAGRCHRRERRSVGHAVRIHHLYAVLDQLVATGLLFRQGVPPHATYLFKHALVQESRIGASTTEVHVGGS